MSKVRWFCSDPEREAALQVQNTASMPFVHGVAVMPDCHFGRGSTVGTVVATKGAIMPACVGVDIGCGMIAVRTSIKPEQLGGKLQQIREGIERRIPVGIGQYGLNNKISPSADARILELEELSAKLFDGDANHMNARSKDWRAALGTLGGGNHFIEICVGRPWIVDGDAGPLGVYDGPDLGAPEEVWVILHSGSRGVGNKTGTFWTQTAKKLAKKYMYESYLPDPDLAYLVEHSEEFWQYMKELQWCQRFAFLNREEMMDRVLQELFYTIEDAGSPDQIEVERINCHHNYVAKENHDGENFWITRKGAICASVGTRGLIPGSMGARSFIVSGSGNPGAFRSAPHGAGRRMSRNAARKAFTIESLRADMEFLGIEARVRKEIVDEAPGAYKDINTVMADARDLITPTHVLRQIINVKGD